MVRRNQSIPQQASQACSHAPCFASKSPHFCFSLFVAKSPDFLRFFSGDPTSPVAPITSRSSMSLDEHRTLVLPLSVATSRRPGVAAMMPPAQLAPLFCPRGLPWKRAGAATDHQGIRGSSDQGRACRGPLWCAHAALDFWHPLVASPLSCSPAQCLLAGW